MTSSVFRHWRHAELEHKMLRAVAGQVFDWIFKEVNTRLQNRPFSFLLPLPSRWTVVSPTCRARELLEEQLR